MKNKVRILALVLMIVLAAVLSGCGTTEARYGVKENFELSGTKYAVEKWVLRSETDSTATYDLSVLIVGQEAPITFVLGSNQVSSGVGATVDIGEKTVGSANICFTAIDDVPGYGVRALFTFNFDKGTELPKKGALVDAGNKENKVLLDLSGLPVEEQKE